jgi:uncharacterized protein (TIGR03066 family)
MKLSTRIEQFKRQKDAKRPKPPKPRPVRRAGRPWTWRHWGLLALWLFLAAGGAWAALELVVWNRLPPELVGKWQVKEGPMAGGAFYFSRSGTLEIHGNNQGRYYTLKGRVALEGKNLLTTTQNPRSQQDETRTSVIQELTANSLILELESGEVLKMVRQK